VYYSDDHEHAALGQRRMVALSVGEASTDAKVVAYEDAYRAYWGDVFRFAVAWTNDWGAAEDLAQEAYVRLWRVRDNIDWTTAVLPWLLVATRRLATDRFRRLRVRSYAHPATTMPDESTLIQWLDIQAAMSALSSIERSAIVLTTLKGLSYEEAGTVLGISPGSARSAVSRARAKLEGA
jgi:RNA polymerase sigma-70 factor, ECF subfamily